MLALGIESTAHTFGCAIAETKGKRKGTFKILSDVRSSYRPPEGSGIHPREASRHHANVCIRMLKEAVKRSSLKLEDIDIIGYSAGPGLGPCLRIGAVLARLLSAYYRKPLVPVNHALAHIELGAWLTGASNPLVILVSGGHTMILVYSDKRWRIFGETLDITLGQLLDQFGRSLGFSSPCGPMIERLANNSNKNQRQQLIESIKQGSMITWQHVNLQGEYDFTKLAANDTPFDLTKIFALQIG